MGVVIDIIAPAPGHIDSVAEEEDRIDNGRYRNPGEYIQGFPGTDHYKGEHDGAHGPGGTQAPVIIIVALFEIGWDIGYDKGGEIQERVIIMLQSENAHVIIFQRPAKKVQGEHIKSKVHKISVDKTA